MKTTDLGACSDLRCEAAERSKAARKQSVCVFRNLKPDELFLTVFFFFFLNPTTVLIIHLRAWVWTQSNKVWHLLCKEACTQSFFR